MILHGAGTAAPAPAWPLLDELPPLGALTTAPGTSRAHVRAVLSKWGLGDLADACVLVASELVTNAVRASATRSGRPVYVNGRMAVIWLRLLSDGTRVVIEVWDQALGFPEPRQAGDDAEGGRGLQLVAMLTGGQWGWQTVRGRPGKCVSAELSAD